MTFQPRNFQARAIKRINKLDGIALVSMEMGLGKTPVALWRTDAANAYPMLVVCPASLKWNWESEAWKFLKKRATVLEGTCPPKKLHTKCPIVIINYDITGPWLPVLKEFGFNTLALDEGHYIKSRKSKRFKNVRALSRGIENRLILTGTPIINRPSELWPLLNVLRPDIWNSFFAYATKHCKPRRRPWGWVYDGAEKLDELHMQLLENVMIRYRTQDVIKDLPPKIQSVVPLELSDTKEYNKAFKDFITWLRRESPAAAVKAIRAIQLSKTNYLKRLAAKLKLPAVFNWLDDFLEESDGKLAMFAYHKSILDGLQERYHKLCFRMDGSTPKKARLPMVEEFNTSKKKRLFFGQIDASGVGLNMTGAHSVAFCEICWTPAQHSQAISRCYARLSDMHGVNVSWLVGKQTIEEDIVKLLHKKQKISDAAIDGMEGIAEKSVFDDLITQLQGA